MKPRDVLLVIAVFVLTGTAHSADPCRNKRCSRNEMCVSFVSPCKTLPCARVAKCLPRNTPSLCPRVNCRSCGKGHLNKYDANGCLTCTCYKPCEGVNVSPQTECVYRAVPGGARVFAVPKKRCLATGDPHYTTFDNLMHHYQGTEEVAMSHTSPLCNDLQQFQVRGYHKSKGDPTVSYMMWVMLYVKQGYTQTTVKIGQDLVIEVNGNPFVVGSAMPTGITSIDADTGTVVTDVGIVVQFDGDETAQIWIPLAYEKCVEGLCGNADGNEENDWINKYGTNCVSLPSSKKEWCYGNSWLINHHGALQTEDNAPRLCYAQTQRKFNRKKYCGALKDKRGPFRKCLRRKRKDAENAYSSCTFDICASKRDNRLAKKLACESIEAFARLCGNLVHANWRRMTGCVCPGQLVWTTCGRNCTRTCRKPRINCSVRCVAKCQCPRTRPFQQGNKCLDIAKCQLLTLWPPAV